jgi:hypothetical protein
MAVSNDVRGRFAAGLLVVGACAGLLASSCSSRSIVTEGERDTSVGGSRAIDDGNVCPRDRLLVVPGADGSWDSEDACNDVGLRGGWYAYGDQYTAGHGDARCVTIGKHLPEECSIVTIPDPTGRGFPNAGGVMRTAGVSAKVLPCPPGLATVGCPALDLTNMVGSGIGFDLDAVSVGDAPPSRRTWDPAAHGVIGLEFTVDVVPPQGLRVEFPMLLEDAEAANDEPPLPPGSTTEQHSALSPYWGAQAQGDSKYPSSPVVAGTNRILWEDIAPPRKDAYAFDSSRILGVRFHVPTSRVSSEAYSFAISDITLPRK